MFDRLSKQKKKKVLHREAECACMHVNVCVGKGAGYFLAELWYSSSTTTSTCSSRDSYIQPVTLTVTD